jgi:hypothetical protein
MDRSYHVNVQEIAFFPFASGSLHDGKLMEEESRDGSWMSRSTLHHRNVNTQSIGYFNVTHKTRRKKLREEGR